MAFRSEAEIWADERRKVAERPKTIAERVARWFDRPAPQPQPDHFTWRAVADLIPISGDDA